MKETVPITDSKEGQEESEKDRGYIQQPYQPDDLPEHSGGRKRTYRDVAKYRSEDQTELADHACDEQTGHQYEHPHNQWYEVVSQDAAGA